MAVHILSKTYVIKFKYHLVKTSYLVVKCKSQQFGTVKFGIRILLSKLQDKEDRKRGICKLRNGQLGRAGRWSASR